MVVRQLHWRVWTARADLRALGRAAREAHALLVVDNTVASAFGCDSLRLGSALSLEALDRVCAGDAPRKLVAVSVARSQLKRHRVDAAAECAHTLLEGCGLAKFELTADEAGVLERGLDSLDVRMQRISTAPVRWPSIWPPTRWCATCAIPD